MTDDRWFDLFLRLSEGGLVLAMFGALTVVGVVILWPVRQLVFRWVEVTMSGMPVPTSLPMPMGQSKPYGNGAATQASDRLREMGRTLDKLAQTDMPLMMERQDHAKRQLDRIEGGINALMRMVVENRQK